MELVQSIVILVIGLLSFCSMAAAFVLIARRGGWQRAMQPTAEDRWPLPRRLTFVGAMLGVLFGAMYWVLPGNQDRPEPQREIRLGTFGWLSLGDAVASRDDGYLSSSHYHGTQFVRANDEYAFVVIGAVEAEAGRYPHVLGPDPTDSTNRHFHGGWLVDHNEKLAYHCMFPTGDVASGIMRIGNAQWNLADGRVFLVNLRDGAAAAEVQQVNAQLLGDEVEQALKNLVANNDAVRAWLAADLTEGLRSNDRGRRWGAAMFVYRCGLGGELKTALLVEFLKDDEMWVRLMAADALWDRQRHEAAIPTLAALLQETGEFGPRIAWQSARVLGEIGPEAQAAAPALREALECEDEMLRKTAAEALQKVETGHEKVL